MIKINEETENNNILLGKVIKNVDSSASNVLTIFFEDNSKLIINADSMWTAAGNLALLDTDYYNKDE